MPARDRVGSSGEALGGTRLLSFRAIARSAIRRTWPQHDGTDNDGGDQQVELHGCTPQLHAGATPCRTHAD
jgi:hypothetical protein